MNLVTWKAILAAALSLPALILGTGNFASGPAVGESVNAFHPHHVTGADRGTDTCPVCKYGGLPAVQVWVNSETSANVQKIAATLDRAIEKVGIDHLRAFVVDVNQSREGDAAISRELSSIAITAKLHDVAMTYLSGPDAGPVAEYKINVDPTMRSTILVYRNRRVVKNIVNLDTTKAGLQELYQSAIADATAK